MFSRNIFLNGSISLAHENKLPIFAHVIIDSNFVNNRFDLIRKYSKNIKLILSLGALCSIAERDFSIIKNNDIYIIRKLIRGNLFSNDISNYLVEGGTVMASAMQIVFYSNPSVVFLLGLDISNCNLPRFYEKKIICKKVDCKKIFIITYYHL